MFKVGCRVLPLLLLFALAGVRAQQAPPACEVTPLSPAKPGANMFTAQQEVDLGDLIAEQIPARLRPIDDRELAERLQQTGDRLVKHLPPTGLNFRFYLSDAPIANAFSIVGGRVYVTRKMIGLFRNEDELAGVMGHELGHIVTHQQAKQYTRLFREKLGITEVGDREDILSKYNRLLDQWAKHGNIHEDAEEDQQEADRLGLEATVRAGYSPQSLADFWDRFTENKGKTGTWFSELLETTAPETKRYREMVKTMAAMPAACKDLPAYQPAEAFRNWQLAVVNTRGMRRSEALHGVVWRKTLEPPLQDVIHTLKFSADGKFVLAQDSGNIYVLTHQPFQVVFRIDAYDAYPAKFTPDSQAIVFYDKSLRVEKWDIASQQRSSANEVYIHSACIQTLLSPDGKTLACYRANKDLELVEVATGDALLEKKNFLLGKSEYQMGIDSLKVMYTVNFLNLGFSPDGRYFLASLRNENSIAFDISERHEIPVSNALKPFIGTAFAFRAPNQLVGYAGGHGEKSAIVEFPSGKLIRSIDLGGARPTPATHGDYLLIRPIKDNAVGILDIALNQIVGANKQSAMDVYDKQYIVELKNGHIGLFGDVPAPIAEAALTRGSFGRLRSVALSDDLNWLAVSGRARGGVWAIPSSSRVLNLREFRGAYIGQDGALLADFPKHDPAPRSIARIALAQRQFTEAMRPSVRQATQEGPYLLTLRPAKEAEDPTKTNQNPLDPDDSSEAPVEGVNFHLSLSAFADEVQRNTILEVHQIQTGGLLWSRNFPKESPDSFTSWVHGTIVLAWPMSAAAAKSELNDHPDWKNRFPQPREKDLLLEVLEMQTGKVLHGFVLNTGEGSFSIDNAIAGGDWLVLHDNRGRAIVYSLRSGRELGRAFGNPLSFSEPSELLCLENVPGKLQLFDLPTMTQTDEMSFASEVSSVDFVGKGDRLFVLTGDQNAYLLEPRRGSRTSP